MYSIVKNSWSFGNRRALRLRAHASGKWFTSEKPRSPFVDSSSARAMSWSARLLLVCRSVAPEPRGTVRQNNYHRSSWSVM